MTFKPWSTCLLLIGLSGLGACSSTEVVRAPLDISIGQQLIDLKKAHASGAVNDREYDQQRRQLINNVR